MSNIQSDLFHACRELLPSLEQFQVNVVESSQARGMWNVVVDDMKGRTPRAAMFQVDARQWHMWSDAERAFYLRGRIDNCVENIKAANEGLLD